MRHQGSYLDGARVSCMLTLRKSMSPYRQVCGDEPRTYDLSQRPRAIRAAEGLACASIGGNFGDHVIQFDRHAVAIWVGRGGKLGAMRRAIASIGDLGVSPMPGIIHEYYSFYCE